MGDDGSTDGTLDLIRSFSGQSAVPLRIFCNRTKLGYGDNFLATSTAAVGDIIAFADQDDVWHVDKLRSVQRAFLENRGAHVVAHSYSLVNARGEKLKSCAAGIHKSGFVKARFMNPWGVFPGFSMAVRGPLLRIFHPSERYTPNVVDPLLSAHDRWVYFLAHAAGGIQLIKEDLVQYRQHGENLYGAPQKHLSRLVGHTVRSEAQKFTSRYAAIADHRALLCKRLAELDISSEAVQSATEAHSIWVDVATSLRHRLAIYEQESLPKRLAGWYTAMASGAYRVQPRLLDNARALSKDLLAAVRP